MGVPSRKVVALSVFSILSSSLPSLASATNGYFLIGFGSKSRAMGGVGIALGQDGLAAASNPAAISDVKVSTMRVDGSLEFFIPRRAAWHNSALLPADEVSGSNQFLIPAMGGLYKFNRKITIGFAAVGAGVGTRYDQSWDPVTKTHNGKVYPAGYFFNFNGNASDTLGVSMMQMQMLPTVAYKLSKKHTVAASLAIGVQTFRAYGLEAFGAPGSPLNYTSDRTHLSNKGNDWSYGAGVRVGWLGKFFKKKLSVGAYYASRVYMTKFDKYRGLFAEQGDFDIPAHFGVGIAVRPNKQWTVAFDVTRTLYSTIASVANPGPDPKAPGIFWPADFGCPTDGRPVAENECALGRDKGLGFGWKDQTVYKLGVSYKYDRKWTFRAGLNYGKAPIPSDQILFAMLAPATTEKHVTLGFSYQLNPQLEVSMNYMHAFKNTITGKTAFYPEGISNYEDLRKDNAAISMYQHSIGITIGYKL